MLTQMRALSQNVFGRAILGVVLVLIIASFAIWGIGDRFTNYDANQIAKVGAVKITTDQYRNAYTNELQQMQRKERRGINNDEARRLGIDRDVLRTLLTDALLDQQAARLGLAVGNDEITREIMGEATFKGQNGQFDRATFDRLLRENNYTETSYANAQRRLILRQDVSTAVVGGLQLPALVGDAVHRFQAEVRDADFFILPPAAAGTVPAPDDKELQAYYDAHATSYTAPEFRKLNVLSVVPVDLVKPDAVSDADVKARYESQKAARFEVPERRTIEQLVFPDAQAAQAAEAKVKGGESFDKLVTDEKKLPADVSLGAVAKSDLADKAVADAAFALPEGGTSAPVKGEFGTVLLHVSKITPGHTQPLMEVSAQLKDEVAIIKAKQQAEADSEKVESARTAGKTLAEAAAAAGLKVRAIDAVDAQGRGHDGKPVEGLVAGPQLLKAAFASDVGADTEMIQTKEGGYEWYEVAAIDPAHQLSFAQVKPKVEAAWRAEETARRLAAEGDRIVKAIEGGKTIAAAAAEAKQPLMQARNVGRGGAPTLPSPEASALFDQPVGKPGSVSAQGRGRLIFTVIAARVPPIDPKNPEWTKLIEQVKGRFENDVTAQYLERVQREIGVTFNQKALDNALGGDPGS